MTLSFGTSGVRGLVSEMDDKACYLFTRAFLQYCLSTTTIYAVGIAGDLRASTPRIMRAVARAILDERLEYINYGAIPTPALLCEAIQLGMASIMVTGSHIPDDRNGIKFNMPTGEVLKTDEPHILDNYEHLKIHAPKAEIFDDHGMFLAGYSPSLMSERIDAMKDYRERYTSFFSPDCLGGKTIVVYQHSSVARDIMAELLREFGAKVVLVGRSDQFIPVDTEAVENSERLAEWVLAHEADALVTADGDGDRPLVVDDTGGIVRGDLLGILVAQSLNAAVVVAPINCNTALEKTGTFQETIRTKIGSPYVLAAINEAINRQGGSVVGYEANGGFMLGTDIVDSRTNTQLAALPTRDALLPILSILATSALRQKPVSELLKELPQRYTVSGLLRHFPNKLGRKLVALFDDSAYVEIVLSKHFGNISHVNYTDGPRITFSTGDILHIRPSGNAPEFRIYTEAGTIKAAESMNEIAMEIIVSQKESLSK